MNFVNLKWHRAGKISVLSGGTVVNGENTNWLEADIKAGDMLITTDARPYEVDSVNNSTQLTLTEPYKGDTVTGGDYAIVLRIPAVMQAEIANRLVTVLGEWDRRDRSFSETLTLLVNRLEKVEKELQASGVLTIPITIPVTGWIKDVNDTTGYPFHVDVANDVITEDMTPFLTILPVSLSTAKEAGICKTAETLSGILRVYSKTIPEANISASLALSGAAASLSGLPVASATTLGLMKPGRGLEAEDDGTVNVTPGGSNTATNEQANAILDNAFGSGDASLNSGH